MKVKVDCEEYYPFFIADANGRWGTEIKMDDAEYRLYQQVMEDFQHWQKFLASEVKDARTKSVTEEA